MSDSQTATNQSTTEKEGVYTFSKGIPGFHEITEYMVVQQITPFSLLQSASHPETSFIMIDPFVYYPDYEFELPQEVVDELGITKEEHVVIRNIVSWNKKAEHRTVNLVAPIIFNIDNHQAKQIILQNTQYTIRHPLQPNVAKGGES
ncbi:flagellar assembly protein FliW [Paenibacillus sp. PK4536]|uniref:flagellar assembly protein FliW n=1 Tax=Paenibacillus TaxID=44249 RepID=UPI0023580E90|nr:MULTISPECIES: flagellar assembly protein FliW [Paenibacillus]WIM39826.1 flagellar assembly protein FliW [Paenibacillus sp. PK4536]CAJ1317859.1 Flagellar assembly factor FliW [Paenibacillus nuruki]